jgi:drug/metabolite transporter (DMT)-like permease
MTAAFERPTLPPMAALAVGVAAVSTGAIFVRAADAPALVTAAYRVGIASVVLLPLVLLKARRDLRTLSFGDLRLAVAAGAFLALHFATWIASLDHTSVAASVILVNTNPIWVGLLTPLLTSDRIQGGTVVCILLSVTGAVIIGWGDIAVGGRALWGDALALMGSIFAALYLLLGRNLRGRIGLLAYIFLCYGSAALFLWGAVAVSGQTVLGFSKTTWSAFFGMALFSQLVGHTSYNWALKWISTSAVAISLLGEPIGASLLAYLLFGESLTGATFIGGGLILMAIYLVARQEMRKSDGTTSDRVQERDAAR